MTLRHRFTCLIPDDPVAQAAGEALPQRDWNDDHVTNAADKAVLRSASGVVTGDGGLTWDSGTTTLNIGTPSGTDFGALRIHDGVGSYFELKQYSTGDGFAALGLTFNNSVEWNPFLCEISHLADALAFTASPANPGPGLLIFADSGIAIANSGGAPGSVVQMFFTNHAQQCGMVGTTTNHKFGIFTNNSNGDYFFHPDLSLTRSDSLFGVTAAGVVNAVGANLSGLTASRLVATDSSKNLVSYDAANLKITTLPFIIDGGGATIITGIKGDFQVDFACTINAVTLLADQSGSIVVDIWKDTYANYPPVVGDSITASAKPTLSTADKSTDSTLTGWTTSLAAGDTLRYKVDSITTCQRVTVSLKVTKT